jgi:hypothetical protein
MSIPRSLPQVRRWSELLHVRQAGNIIYDRPGRSAFQPRKIRDPSLTAKISKHSAILKRGNMIAEIGDSFLLKLGSDVPRN